MDVPKLIQLFSVVADDWRTVVDAGDSPTGRWRRIPGTWFDVIADVWRCVVRVAKRPALAHEAFRAKEMATRSHKVSRANGHRSRRTGAGAIPYGRTMIAAKCVAVVGVGHSVI